MERNFAKISEISVGDTIEVDGGFGCIAGGSQVIVRKSNHGLYFLCDQGRHYLDGQRDGDVYSGIYKVS